VEVRVAGCLDHEPWHQEVPAGLGREVDPPGQPSLQVTGQAAGVLDRARAGAERRERGGRQLVGRGEPTVDGRLAHARPGRHPLHAQALEPLFDEELQGRGQDRAVRLRAAWPSG
jgi:hypothetical protein